MTLLDKLHNRTARVLQHRWRMRDYQSIERHIVIGGSPRSGTSFFRRILGRHPSVASGAETGILLPGRLIPGLLELRSDIPAAEIEDMIRSSDSQAAFVDRFAMRFRIMHEKARWAEKTPLNVRHFDWVLEHFPEARLVHLIRDGRDVVCSLAEHPDRRWVNGRLVEQLVTRPLSVHARAWVADTGAGMRLRGDPRYLEVRYEDLVADTEAMLRRVCSFLDEPFDVSMLRRASFGSSVGRWRRDLPAYQREEVQRICLDRLRELGYPQE